MKRHVPGLHAGQLDSERPLEGLFLVRVDWASYRWHPHRPFLAIRLLVLEPKSFERRSFSGRLYSTERALWKLNWFFGTSATTPNCSARTKWTRRPLSISEASSGRRT
jgi:hypothetical protein